jgi:hypothetical protein
MAPLGSEPVIMDGPDPRGGGRPATRETGFGNTATELPAQNRCDPVQDYTLGRCGAHGARPAFRGRSSHEQNS